MKSVMQPPLEFLSNFNGFAKPEIRICSKGNVSSFFVSDNKRTSILFVIKELAFQICFLLNQILYCTIMIRFGFSSLRFRKVSVALLLLLFREAATGSAL